MVVNRDVGNADALQDPGMLAVAWQIKQGGLGLGQRGNASKNQGRNHRIFAHIEPPGNEI
jgi:hypothetical protein